MSSDERAAMIHLIRDEVVPLLRRSGKFEGDNGRPDRARIKQELMRSEEMFSHLGMGDETKALAVTCEGLSAQDRSAILDEALSIY